ncbi:MAG TPA: Lrp/AsnC family transcriptional regulator [Acidobacteriaceae bacterium]|nr:Lrp/AsnC family transcriptional regulator [Acidobacteriaceae bacterium]
MPDFVRLSRKTSRVTEKSEEKSVIDDRDKRILSALSMNSRLSYNKLAKVANLSPNATAERVHRLQELGVIQSFSLDVSPAALGLHLQAFIDVKLQPGTSMEAFEKALRGVHGIREAASITGSFDARLWVDCKDADQLGSLIEQLRRQTGILETSSTVICRELKIKPIEKEALR